MAENETISQEGTEVKVEETSEVVSDDQATQGGEGAKPKKSFSEVMRRFMTPECIVGVIAILLIPCFFMPWVHLPVTEKVGLNIELSMPDALSKGSSVVGALEQADSALGELGQIADKAVDIAGKAAEVAAVATAALNADPSDYKAALSTAITALVESVIDSGNPVAASAGEQIEKSATSAANEAVDNAASSIANDAQAQENLDKAGKVAATVSEEASTAQDAAEKAQGAINTAQQKLQETLQLVKTILGVANVVWYVFLLLLLVAGILLIVGLKGRYVTGIIALSLSTISSLAAVIGISVGNQVIVDAIANSVGVWVLAFIPSVIAVTAWPWVVAIASIVCLVAVCILLKRHRKQLSAAMQSEDKVALEPTYVESGAQEASAEA